MSRVDFTDVELNDISDALHSNIEDYQRNDPNLAVRLKALQDKIDAELNKRQST